MVNSKEHEVTSYSAPNSETCKGMIYIDRVRLREVISEKKRYSANTSRSSSERRRRDDDYDNHDHSCLACLLCAAAAGKVVQSRGRSIPYALFFRDPHTWNRRAQTLETDHRTFWESPSSASSRDPLAQQYPELVLTLAYVEKGKQYDMREILHMRLIAPYLQAEILGPKHRGPCCGSVPPEERPAEGSLDIPGLYASVWRAVRIKC
ncbi:hypothetical protein HPB50_009677 [Hyalomma asiaticum]|uniref:Uncharacterized protein n=1 Tax=Hyalomma asiaticum TaxID=266040 RepID=A0ACB7TCZ8_HYAAI|nr:hypothetical protein HPB50_009677 [Hyalomma asiaticum]